MPFYEYRCQECNEELESLQKISDPPLVDCPACGKPALKKQISAAGFRLKGGGWYETDFKSDNKRNLHDGSKSSADNNTKKSSENATKADKPKSESKSGSTPSPTKSADKSTGS